jgi:hypothetical protein
MRIIKNLARSADIGVSIIGPWRWAEALVQLCPYQNAVALSPWVTLVRTWSKLGEARAAYRRQHIRMFFQKAILHHQAELISSMCSLASVQFPVMRLSNLKRSIKFFLQPLISFSWNAERFLLADSFLRLAGALWDLTMAPWPDNIGESLMEINNIKLIRPI